MSGDQSPNSGFLPLSLARRVDEACDRFEAAWRAGHRPRIEEFLADAPEPERRALLRALLALKIELRSKSGDKPTPAEYEHRFPGHSELIKAVFAEALSLNESGRSPGNGEPGTVDEITPLPSESPPALPDRIGRYKVCGHLGSGKFGDVYLAHDDLMDRRVAIKVPSAWLVASQSAKHQFLSEARSVARLQHEGIVRAYDFGQEADGRCFIVYEFVEGTNLEEPIERDRFGNRALPLADAAGIAAQVAEALHYAHLQGLIHRDIKPANILLDRQGKPRVTDFGLAVREEDLPNERGRLAGTIPYMSPEQLRRQSHHIDGRTDIYSLGVVLYELLCGRRPFAAKTVEELEDQILHREAKPPRQIRDSIPQELERICLKALSKRVQDRYSTAKDMAVELYRAIEAIEDRARELDRVNSLVVIEQQMSSADEDELRRLLRSLQQAGDPACVRLVFRYLAHPSEAVREQARKVIHSLGWSKVSAAIEDLARRGEAADIASVLDGLAAFEAHPQVVELLDRIVLLVKDELRNRTILLLERKRLGLELNDVAALFRDIHSPYRIEKALGQGLFAAAYLACVDGADLKVVVRVLRPEFASQPQIRVQFLDLSKKALKLVHENLVLTREVRAFPERNTYFVVRDYVNGVTLQKLLEGGKRFGGAQILRILRQVLLAVGAVHRSGMCHGGVKPSNVFICEDDRVVVGDPSLPVQKTGVALERLSYDYRYAAPETFDAKAALGPQADFYSLGCVAYELVSGQPPFVSDNYLELATRHMHEEVVKPSQRNRLLGAQCDEFLLKLLARSPADRHARSYDVLDALDHLKLDRLELGMRLEGSRRGPSPRIECTGASPPTDAPLLHDASLAHFQADVSIVGFDPSAPDLESLAAPAPAPELPKRIGVYEVIEPIGSGGMGVVYKARHVELDRMVALKVLRAGPNPAPEQLARFKKEARAVARLDHPNIVKIYDVGEYEEFTYLALEYVGGGNLAGKPRAEAPERVRAAVTTVAALAWAVQHAHKQGIVHRDLKPSNILLTEDGQPKITDFGLVKVMDPAGGDADTTAHGTIAGTPAYMPPEQAAGNVAATGPAADIYGLGAILYALLTGEPPFKGQTAFETLSQLATQPPKPPSTLNARVDPSLDSICLKCLEKDPQNRYTSARTLAEDLEHWLAGKPFSIVL
jgi:serine/threonine protein kinase